jgi:hypothetical protein
VAAICPNRFTQLRIISGIRSIPSIKPRPDTGTPIVAKAGVIVTTPEDGTGATVSETKNVAKIIPPNELEDKLTP